MAAIYTLKTPPPPKSSYINSAFSTDSLEDEDSSSCITRSPSPKGYSFTPRRVAKLPRAWERKPATPFAPRSEGQRIWKRVPLGETPANFKARNDANNKMEEGLKVLKKLRTDDTDEENTLYRSTKWDDTIEVVKRKVSRVAGDMLEVLRSSSVTSNHGENDIIPDADEIAEEVLNVEGQMDVVQESGQRRDENISLGLFEKSVAVVDTADINQAPGSNIATSTHSDDQSQPTANLVISAEGIDGIPLQKSKVVEWQSANEDARKAQVQHVTDNAPVEAVTSTSPNVQRRSSLAALFTGEGLFCLPEPVQDFAATNTGEPYIRSAPIAHDDTAFLHEFLTRARAQKAAKASPSPEKMTTITTSPTKKSRQVLATLDANSPSPSKDDRQQLQDDDISDAKTSSPCRRSNRPRLPRPQKVITTVPSNIHVRRSNGTEFIFLQRTEAQEIALATRANTKRNKGDAMHPKIKLPYVNDQAMNPSPTKSAKRRKGGKEVSWDEQLARFCEDKVEHQGERGLEVQETTLPPTNDQPKGRKMTKLGTVNGTPAPKRMMSKEVGIAMAMESQIPSRRLRSQVKS